MIHTVKNKVVLYVYILYEPASKNHVLTLPHFLAQFRVSAERKVFPTDGGRQRYSFVYNTILSYVYV